MMEVSRYPRLGIIGAGRVGSNLTFWLARAGWHICGVHDLNKERGFAAARFVPTGYFARIDTLCHRTDVLLIAVKDSALFDIAEQIGAIEHCRARVLIHTSGAIPSRILKDAGAEFSTASMHPATPIERFDRANNAFKNVLFAIEGDEEASSLSEKIAISLGGVPFRLPSEMKPLYHSACAMASNNIFALLEAAYRLFCAAGIDEQNALRIVALLSGRAVENFADSGLNALTGPLVRGDGAVIAEHLDALNGRFEHSIYKETLDYLTFLFRKAKF